MALTLRRTKGEALTYDELDDNFSYLEGLFDAFGNTEAAFAKLAGIEEFATQDQTAAEIKIAYESNANTNAFDDAYKQKLDYLTITEPFDADASESLIAYLDVFTANGSANTFNLTFTPSSNSHISVFIDGVYQNSSAFSYSNTSLTLSETPANGSIVEARTFPSVTEVDAIDQVFTVAHRVKLDFITVTGYVDLDDLGDMSHNFLSDYTTARDS